MLISGCRDEELAAEFLWPLKDGSTARHGALTYFLAQALDRATAGTTYRTVFEDVAAKVTQVRQGKQHPQMEGKSDRVLFGLDELPPMRYVRLAGVNDAGTAVTLAAGAALLVAFVLSLLTGGALWVQLERLMAQVQDGTFSAVDFDNFDQFF